MVAGTPSFGSVVFPEVVREGGRYSRMVSGRFALRFL